MILVYLPRATQQRISSIRRISIPLEVLIAILDASIHLQFDQVKLMRVAYQQCSLLQNLTQIREYVSEIGNSEQVEVPGYGL